MMAFDGVGLRDQAVTVLIAAVGAVVFWALGLPMPFLTGPAMAVTLAAARGVPVTVSVPVRNICFLALGLNIGGGVTPEVLETAAEWLVSLGLLAVLLLASMLLSMLMLERLFGFDRTTALLSASPGHLSYVMSLASDRNLAIETIALVQSIRLLLLTLLVPVSLVLLGAGSGTGPAPPTAPMRMVDLIVLGAVAMVLARLFLRLDIPAAVLLAGMAVSAVGHGSGLTPGAQPTWLATGAFVMLGALIGTRFRGVTLGQVRRCAGAGLAVAVLSSAIALAGAAGLAAASGLNLGLLFIAYAPGGVESMAAMAMQLDLAPAVVAAHHVLRLVILSVLVPVLMPRGG